jgi:hypothetical protein
MPASGPSNKLVRITSAVLRNVTQAATMKADISAILKIDNDIQEYHRELQLIIDLQKEIQVSVLIIWIIANILVSSRVTSGLPIKQFKFEKDS